MPSDPPLAVRQGPDDQTRDLTSRAIQLRAATIDEQDRSVEAAIATENPVQVYDYRSGGVIDEVLRADGAQLPAQIPLLAVHNRWELEGMLGSIRALRREGSEIVGRLQFAAGDDPAERAWQLVRQGHLTDVSVGYLVRAYVDLPAGTSQTIQGRTYTAGPRTLRISTDWTPREGSLVPVGADPRSKVRGDDLSAGPGGPPTLARENPPMDKYRAFLQSLGLRAEATDEEAHEFLAGLDPAKRAEAEALRAATPAVPAAPPATPANPPDAGRQQDPAAAERERVVAIEQLAEGDVPAELRAQAIREGWSAERAGREFLGAVRAARHVQAPVVPYQATAAAAQPRAEGDLNARTLAAAMMISAGLDPTRHSLHNGRRDPRPSDRIVAQDAERADRFRRLSAHDLVRACVMADTGRMHWDVEEALEAVRSTPSGGTLSYVFTTNVYARLLEGWTTVGDTTLGWCDEEDVANFLTNEDISLSADAALSKLARGDTAKDATLSDSRETYKIARYAKKFAVDEQDLIDDRLGAIMRMPFELGEAARNLRPDMVYAVLLENPTMTDKGAVFNATAVTTAGGHANLTTAALSNDALKAAISAMVKQRLNRTTANPGRQLNIRPRFLLVPAGLEWTARGLTSAAALSKLFADSSDPWYAQLNLIAQEGLRVVVDDRIGAIGVMDPRTNAVRTGLDTNWFLFQGGSRGIRVAYRRGTNRQPQMRSFTLDRGQWGLGWDINLDIGVAVTEWRTMHKSTGAA